MYLLVGGLGGCAVQQILVAFVVHGARASLDGDLGCRREDDSW